MADRAKAALEKTAASLTQRLQTRAQEQGWPRDLAKSLSVIVNDDGDLLPRWPTNRQNEVLEQEFGGIGTRPNPAIHSFFSNPDSVREMRREAESQMTDLIYYLDRALFS